MQQPGSTSSQLFYKGGAEGEPRGGTGGEFISGAWGAEKGQEEGQSSGTTGKRQEKSSDFQQSALATGSAHPPCLQAQLGWPLGSAQGRLP